MQSQRIPDDGSADSHSEEEIDNTVLDFMLCGGSWPWTTEEISRELGDAIDAEDAISRLVGSGLAHRLGNFVIPTRTARRASELRIGTV